MSEYIPVEVQEEILKRLPVKPLIQFRSVSKAWKSLIDSPEFIAAYGVRETHPNRLILRYKDNIDGQERYLTFVDNDDDDHTFIKKDDDFASIVPDLIKNIEPVVGSSNGLLCFDKYYDGTEIVVLWNPSIRKSVGIRVPYMYDSPIKVDHVIGFGVCPVTFDPTILKIEGLRVGFPWKVEVFTLSTGTWSILSTNLPRESVRLRGPQVVIDRFIYWLAYDMHDPADGRARTRFRFLIMSFDVTAKEFKVINLPNWLCTIHSISKLRESLVLLEYQFVEDVSCLWMMKEQGVSRSFTKLYTISLSDFAIYTLLGFRKTGELITETLPEGKYAQLEIYDPNSKAIDNLRIDGDGSKERYLTFVDNDDDIFIKKEDFVSTVPGLIKYIEPVVGSSHGLLCFNCYHKYPDGRSSYNKYYGGTEIVVLWNPSIRKSVVIEVPRMFSPFKVDHVIGFGVCPVTFDPTILKIEGFRVGFPWKVGVFTLSTGTWSILSTNLPRESIRLRGSQVVIDRFIYWLAYDILDPKDGRSRLLFRFLMSFDVTAKEFKEINLPNWLCIIHSISKLRESLVLLEYQLVEDVSCLWMMKEQGVSRSFTKLYTISLSDFAIYTLLGFRKTGELITETQQEGEYAQLEIYDPNSKAIDNLRIDGDRNSFFMCSYMETLLLLDQLDGFIYSISDNSLTINKPP